MILDVGPQPQVLEYVRWNLPVVMLGLLDDHLQNRDAAIAW
jgi:hypothetical protein